MHPEPLNISTGAIYLVHIALVVGDGGQPLPRWAAYGVGLIVGRIDSGKGKCVAMRHRVCGKSALRVNFGDNAGLAGLQQVYPVGAPSTIPRVYRHFLPYRPISYRSAEKYGHIRP